jgi:gamma-glutamyltranspeptidase/glutathione hydrolase
MCGSNRSRLLRALGVVALVSLGGAWTHSAEVAVAEGGQYAVVAGHEAAVEAGMRMLQSGGTAMDAAVAVSLCLGVAEPYGSGVGGKLAMVYWSEKESHATYVEAMDESGSRFDAASYRAMGALERQAGGAAVAVPGLLRGLEAGHRLFGRLTWKACVEPAVEAARDGVEVKAGMEAFFEKRRERVAVTEAAAALYLPAGVVPQSGERLRNADLARTLAAVAEGGADVFYIGEMAERLASGIREAGGHLTADDFGVYAAGVSEPLRVEWHGLEIVAAGPPVHGSMQFLLALRVLDALDWSGVSSLRSVAGMNRVGRVFESVYPPVQAQIADSAVAWEQAGQLLSDESVHQILRQMAAAGEATAIMDRAVADPDLGSTTHFVVWDGEGNIACVTQSLSHHFGSGVVVPGTGVLFNNSLTNFGLSDVGSVNAAEPRKRPRSTICPVLVLSDGRPVVAIGLPGGGRIPTAMATVFLDRWLFGRSLEEAIADRRFHPVRDPSPSTLDRVMALEGDWPESVMGGLRARGWQIEQTEEPEYFGGFCAVERFPGGRLIAYADQRRANAAQAN